MVFCEDDPPTFLFIVTGGVIKLFKQLADGRRQITAFLFPGDYFGFPLGSTYGVSAEPVGRATLCRLRWDDLHSLAEQIPDLVRRLLEQSSNALASAQDQILLLGRKSARERLATFLVLMSSRAARGGKDGVLLFLPMSRGDIGDYLGLALETVSREFRRLREAGLVGVPDDRHVQLLDRSRLIELAELEDCVQADGLAPAMQHR